MLGICAIFRDEAHNLKEWLTFHRSQGFSRFFLFDDGSTDHFREVLAPFVDAGQVILRSAPNGGDFKARQLLSYDMGLSLARKECDWLAVLDIDEFLFAPEGDIEEFLPRSQLVAGVFVWWHIFGSSSRQVPSTEGAIRGFTRRARFPQTLRETKETLNFEQTIFGNGTGRPISGRVVQGKSIFRPESVRAVGDAHRPMRIRGFMVNEDGAPIFWIKSSNLLSPRVSALSWICQVLGFGDGRVPTAKKLRVNHYWSRSVSELIEKSFKWQEYKTRAVLGDYLKWDQALNEVEDLTCRNIWHIMDTESSS